MASIFVLSLSPAWKVTPRYLNESHHCILFGPRFILEIFNLLPLPTAKQQDFVQLNVSCKSRLTSKQQSNILCSPYGWETWSLSSSDKCKLNVVSNNCFRKIFTRDRSLGLETARDRNYAVLVLKHWSRLFLYLLAMYCCIVNAGTASCMCLNCELY